MEPWHGTPQRERSDGSKNHHHPHGIQQGRAKMAGNAAPGRRQLSAGGGAAGAGQNHLRPPLPGPGGAEPPPPAPGGQSHLRPPLAGPGPARRCPTAPPALSGHGGGGSGEWRRAGAGREQPCVLPSLPPARDAVPPSLGARRGRGAARAAGAAPLGRAGPAPRCSLRGRQRDRDPAGVREGSRALPPSAVLPRGRQCLQGDRSARWVTDVRVRVRRVSAK